MSAGQELSRSLNELMAAFEQKYGRKAEFAVAAPGRVNLIGEHTDYNDGYVLPMAIERHTLICATPREDHQVHLATTADLPDVVFDLPKHGQLEPGAEGWANYVKGVLAGFRSRGFDVSGFDALVMSTVPSGGGLSSSAALEVATATLMEAMATDAVLDPVDKALLCQKAEHDFANMPCGIMDQFISVMGKAGHALLIDCRSHQTKAVPLSDPNVTVLLINSNVKHALVEGEYAARRKQCEQASQVLGVSALRDATMDMLTAVQSKMDPVVFRRARHVISENQRTLRAAEAMAAGQWSTVGQLMLESHASMRNDFEITVHEIDTLVELAEQHIDSGAVYGSRMTGGGFGGCTVTLVRTDAVDEVARQIVGMYREVTDIEPLWFATQPAAGAQVLSVA